MKNFNLSIIIFKQFVKIGICIFLFFISNESIVAQSSNPKYKKKDFQLSFFPGISTNGLNSGNFINKYSINLTSGFSAGNTYFEIGGISNLHLRNSSGIQIAGLANVVGSNAFINLTRFEINELEENGLSLDFQGIQFSGLLNFVVGNVTGFQFTGGFNVNYKNVKGIQIAGISNISERNIVGVQLAGLANISKGIVSGVKGVQIAGLINSSNSELYGLQIGSINFAKRIGGKKTNRGVSNTGVQIGLFNHAFKMDGLQIGIINKGKKVHGTQIGLINIYKPGPYPGEGANNKYGTPFGLLNIGFRGNHLRLYSNELFLTLIEFATGNCFNCSWTQSQMPLNGRFKIRNQNSLILGLNPSILTTDSISWGVGYGFQKVHYNKSSMSQGDPNNEKLFFSTGARVLHLNRGKAFENGLSMLTKLNGEIGIRILGLYLITGLSINFYINTSKNFEIPLELFSNQENRLNYQLWLGYTVGIQL